MVAGSQDFGQDSGQTTLDFIVLESQNRESFFGQNCIAFPVSGALTLVNFTINFHDQGCGMAVKIGNVTRENLLARRFCHRVFSAPVILRRSSLANTTFSADTF
jgi:hypothetical protein